MFKMFGTPSVAILDGGLAKWKAEGRPLATGQEHPRKRHFTAWSNDRAVRTKAAMLANVASGAEQVVDARGAGRFTGTDPEPRPGMASGHIPGARNVPHTELFNPDGTYKSRTDLVAAFKAAGVNLDRPVVASCGSGMTACVVLFALILIGKYDVALYDGSWAEWGSDPETPKALGKA